MAAELPLRHRGARAIFIVSGSRDCGMADCSEDFAIIPVPAGLLSRHVGGQRKASRLKRLLPLSTALRQPGPSPAPPSSWFPGPATAGWPTASKTRRSWAVPRRRDNPAPFRLPHDRPEPKVSPVSVPCLEGMWGSRRNGLASAELVPPPIQLASRGAVQHRPGARDGERWAAANGYAHAER